MCTLAGIRHPPRFCVALTGGIGNLMLIYFCGPYSTSYNSPGNKKLPGRAHAGPFRLYIHISARQLFVAFERVCRCPINKMRAV